MNTLFLSRFSSSRGAVIALAFVMLVGLTGCDGATDPPSGPDLVGQWTFAAAGAPEQPVSLEGDVIQDCAVDDLVLTITRNGDALAGSMDQTAQSFFVCSIPEGGTIDGMLTGHSGPLEDIVLEDGNVAFRQTSASGSTGYSATGNLSRDGAMMSGAVRFTLSGFDDGPATFEGEWRAERQ